MSTPGQSSSAPVGSNTVIPTPPSISQATPTLPSNLIEEDQEVQSPSHTETQPVIEHNCNVRGSPNKRGLTSEAWDHFKRQKIDEKWKAICKYCDKVLGGETKVGTKHLHDHIRTCKLRTVRGPKQAKINIMAEPSSSFGDGVESVVSGTINFNQDFSRSELAKMIVLHEYPLAMVDHIGFRRFCSTLQPLFKPITRNTVKSDIMNLYDHERTKMTRLLSKIQSRIAITTDMWTATNQNRGFMSITTHFIDDSWTLQSRLVRFIYVPAPHTAEVLCQVLVDCLFDWNLDRKISTLTVDNCSTNDAMIERFFEKIPSSSFVRGGSLFHMRCCAHILNLIVKEGLSTIEESIHKIRESVSYWVATPKREEKFIEACRQLNTPYSRKLCLDCRTRWNSTYLMLASAFPYKEVFKRLKVRETSYKCLPNDGDWDMASEICDKLEVFYSVTELFSSTQYPTSNLYFPKICEIRLSLNEWLFSDNFTIQVLASEMITKFNKYWGMINEVMAIGAVLDPRYKMKLLNYFFPIIYDNESDREIEKVKILMEDLLNEYQAKDRIRRQVPTSSDSTSSSMVTDGSSFSRREKWKCNYLKYVQDTTGEDNVKSELDCYLEEPVLLDQSNEENFDILGYWKNVGVKYPTLQRIAKDFLAIPISTVASE